MNKRIEKLMSAKNLSATQFSDEIGIQRSSLSHVLSGRNKPSLDFMLKIKSRFPEINLDWLLLGTGKMEVEENPVEEIKEKPVKDSLIDAIPESEPGLFSAFDESADSLHENDEVFVKMEEPPVYQSKSAEMGKQPEKVIILYTDKTFSVYNQKG